MSLTEKIKSYYHTESGRSMVEMLGVLATIGVLSIAGIAGYKFAVVKYRANETIHELFQRVVVYSTQMLDQNFESGAPLSNGEFGDKTSLGYPINAVVSGYQNEFNVYVQNVPSDECVRILKELTVADVVRAMSVNDSVYNFDTEDTSICGKETNKDMMVSFSSNLEWEYVEVSEIENNQGVTTAQPKQEGDACSSNADCQPSGNRMYCHLETPASECDTPQNGVCKKTSSVSVDQFTEDGRTYTVSAGNVLHFWNAKNYCDAIGSHLATDTTDADGPNLIAKGQGGLVSIISQNGCNMTYINLTSSGEFEFFNWTGTTSEIKVFCIGGTLVEETDCYYDEDGIWVCPM